MPYITEYSELGAKEQRQLRYKRRFKEDRADWDDSMVYLVNQLQPGLKHGMSVFDAGCGKHNFVIDELSRGGTQFKNKIGLDINREATEGNTSVDTIVLGNLEAIPAPDTSFDLVTSLWVLEHVESPVKVFKEIHRILKPGGLFAFATPNAGSLLIQMRKLLNKELAEKIVYGLYGRKDEDTFEVHYRANTMDDLKRQAQDSGFQIDRLIENPDPSYTSFGPITYFVSKNMALYGGSLFRPHVIGIWRKA